MRSVVVILLFFRLPHPSTVGQTLLLPHPHPNYRASEWGEGEGGEAGDLDRPGRKRRRVWTVLGASRGGFGPSWAQAGAGLDRPKPTPKRFGPDPAHKRQVLGPKPSRTRSKALKAEQGMVQSPKDGRTKAGLDRPGRKRRRVPNNHTASHHAKHDDDRIKP